MAHGDPGVDDRNLAPTPNEMSVRITRSAGKTYVSWTEQGVRESVTIDDLTAHATDARGWQFISSDAHVVRLLLDGTGIPELATLGQRLWMNYRDVKVREPDPYTDSPDGAVPDTLPPELVAQVIEDLRERSRGRYLDRRLRKLDRSGRPRFAGRPGCRRVATTHVADALPPYLAVDVVTVWTGRDAAEPGYPPWVSETRLVPRSQAAFDVWPEGRTWVLPGCDENGASAAHLDVVRLVSETLGCAVAMPVRSRGRRRDAKPLAGLGGRRRRRQARGVAARAEGRSRVRGRGGRPDRWVSWAWNPATGLYDVAHEVDPVLRPVPRAAGMRGCYRARRRQR